MFLTAPYSSTTQRFCSGVNGDFGVNFFWVPFSGNFHDRMSAKKSLKGPENKMTNNFLSRGYIYFAFVVCFGTSRLKNFLPCKKTPCRYLFTFTWPATSSLTSRSIKLVSARQIWQSYPMSHAHLENQPRCFGYPRGTMNSPLALSGPRYRNTQEWGSGKCCNSVLKCIKCY